MTEVISDEIADKLWRRVDRTGDCWPWTGPVNRWGHGDINAGGRTIKTRRLAYRLQNGAFPAGKVHVSCGNVRCVRGEHLIVEAPPPVDYVDRLWRLIDKRAPDECWEWQGAVKETGYGAFRVRPRTVRPHRFLYEHLHGAQPPDIDICHRCDNRLCCNPAHLFAGTRLDNMLDCARKGRIGNRRTTDEDEAIIRAEPAYRGCVAKLAQRFGVSLTTIIRIRRRAGRNYAQTAPSKSKDPTTEPPAEEA